MAEPTSKPKVARPKVSPARITAFALLRELASSANTHSDDLLQGPTMELLSLQDRHLCTALVMGVLRWQLSLDAAIAPLLTHKSKLDEPVRIALRMGAFQLLLMDRIPAHAAISDSVEVTKRSGHTSAGGMVNAVLRKISTSPRKLDPVAAHPVWMRERWMLSLGENALKAVCSYDQHQPAITLRRQAAHGSEEEFPDWLPGAFLKAAMRLEAGRQGDRKLSSAGMMRWQDEGSQLVAELLGGSSLAPASILDCCAAPGGKTAILAGRFPEARLTAWDISATRVARMRETFRASERLAHIRCEMVDCIAAPVDERYDLVLCDVPCSGTGTLARNPEIKLRLQPADLERQQQRQLAILEAALKHLAPGGRLLYSTCSLEPEENESVIDQMIQRVPGLKLIPIAARLQEMHGTGALHAEGLRHLEEHAVQGAYLRTVPGVSPCDGFFAALITK